MNDSLTKPTTRFRGSVVRGSTHSVARTSGDYDSGLIRGVAVITRGEALGHGQWVDATMLRQVADAINSNDGLGIKARFTHPDASGDALGTQLGKFKNASMDGDVVRADLHFSKAAHVTPDGNLAEYVMALALDHPEDFGASIAFLADLDAMVAHHEEHSRGTDWEELGATEFQSPDPANVDNLPHIRLDRLKAVDVVDEPAANPHGLFHASTLPAEAEALLAYSLGLTDQVPKLQALDTDPGRVAGFIQRFLSRHELELFRREEVMAEDAHVEDEVIEDEIMDDVEVDDDDADDEPEMSDFIDVETGELIPVAALDDYEDQVAEDVEEDADEYRDPAAFVDAFGESQGSIYFTRGLSFSEAQAAELDRLREENTQLRASQDRGEEDPVSFGDDSDGTPAAKPEPGMAGAAGVIRDAIRITKG